MKVSNPTMNKRIFGFAGRMRSGKGILAHAVEENFDGEIITVADALKKLVIEIIPHVCSNIMELNAVKNRGDILDCGISDKDIKLISDRTSVPYEDVERECKNKGQWVDVRDMLQFIGTNIIRKYNPDWHVEKLIANIQNSSKDTVCVDDVRFPNERQAIEKLGGTVFFVIRPQSEILTNHPAETSLAWQNFLNKRIIINDSSESVLQENFTQAVKDNFRWQSENRIFLSANEGYFADNVNFGYEHRNEHLQLIYGMIRNKTQSYFQKHGIIIYDANNATEANNFVIRVKKQSKEIYHCGHRFVLYNPLIFENLKMYLTT